VPELVNHGRVDRVDRLVGRERQIVDVDRSPTVVVAQDIRNVGRGGAIEALGAPVGELQQLRAVGALLQLSETVIHLDDLVRGPGLAYAAERDDGVFGPDVGGLGSAFDEQKTVGAGVSLELIEFAGEAAEETVVAVAAGEDVGAGAAAERVVARFAQELIVAGVAV